MFERGFEFAPGYRLETFLGKGQFGQVWRTTAPGGTLQAVKFIDLTDGQWEKEYQGIQRVKQIRHPNLMPILAIWLLGNDGKALLESVKENEQFAEASAESLDTAAWDGETQGADWFARHSGRLEARWMVVSMLLGGKNLQQRLKECVDQGLTGIPPKELLTLMQEAAKGLDYLNSANALELGAESLQHCDVKPANIVLVGASAVVCDFGLARIMAREQVTASSVAGTPAYMAPETIGGKPSRNSDQYSLAVTYYQLRTNSLPLADGTVWQILEAHRMGTLSFDGVSEAEQQVLRRATRLQWDERFESNGAMVDALREALRPSVVSVEPPAAALPPSRKRRSALAVGGFAAVIGLVTWVFWPGSDSIPGIVPEPATVEADGFDETTSGELLAAPPLDPRSWSELLEVALSDSQEAVSEFHSLLVHHSELKHALPIRLLGPDKDIEQVAWARAATQAARDEPSILITRALTPYVMEFKLAALEDAFVAEHMRRMGQADGVDDRATRLPPPVPQLIEHSAYVSAPSILPNASLDDQADRHRRHNYVSALDLSRDSQWAASGDLDGRVKIWPAGQDEPQVRTTLKLGDVDITAILWHPTEDYLLVADIDGGVHLIQSVPQWPEGSSPEVVSFSLPRGVDQWAFDRLGETLVLLADGELSALPWRACQRLLLNQTPPEPVRLSPPGLMIRRFTLSDSEAAEQMVVAGGDTGEASFYSLSGKGLLQKLAVITQGPVVSLATAGSGDRLTVLSGGEQGKLTLQRGRRSEVLFLPGHRDSVTDVAISPDGQWAASVSRDGWGTLRRLDTAPQNFTAFRDVAHAPLTLVAWHPSGRWLITGGYGGQLTLWDARHLRLLVHCCPQTELPGADQPSELSVPPAPKPMQLSNR